MSGSLSMPIQRFLRLRNAFLRAVNASPAVVTIALTSATQVESGYPLATKTDEREIDEPRQVTAYYTRDFNEFKRTRYGLDKEVTCVVYIPPDNLVKEYGTYHNLPIEKVTVFGIQYAVNKVAYLGSFYNTCMAVEIHLIDEQSL